MSTNLHTKSYSNKDRLFFLLNPNEDIAENDPVRIVDAVVESLDLKEFKKLYREKGRCAYHPKMMLKLILYAYMNNIYSCRKIEKVVQRDIHYIWLAAQERPDFVTINRFRNRVKNEINNIFTQVVLLLAERGFITLDVEYVDGTKIESKANKYTFVWRKSVEKNRARLQEKIRVLLGQIDDAIAQDKAAEAESVEFTPETLNTLIDELKDALAAGPEPADKEQRKRQREKKRQIRELEKHRDKLGEYDGRLEQLDGRNSMSKTDPDATFMRMKEDAMNNGQTKPGYNLQIGTENQYITNFAFYWNPTDSATLPSFLTLDQTRWGKLPKEVCADSGYGSEQNYEFMENNGIEAYVKYNWFHKEQHRPFRNDPFRMENMYYNWKDDYYVCPMGQHMEHVGHKKSVSDNGYASWIDTYRAQRCEGCPLRGQCFKGKGNRTINVNHQLKRYKKKAFERLTSERGLFHRSKRPVEPEAVFGQIKTDKQYKRFRHRGFSKIQMDFGILAMAFNLQKLIKNVGRDQIKAVMEAFSALFGPLLASLWNLWGKFQKEETSVNKNRQLSNRNLIAA